MIAVELCRNEQRTPASMHTVRATELVPNPPVHPNILRASDADNRPKRGRPPGTQQQQEPRRRRQRENQVSC